mgnify:CR=1 FL=1
MEVLFALWSNTPQFISAAFAIHAAALAIVNLTPTPKDDAIVGKLYKVIEFAAGIVSKVAKQ